MIKSLQIEFIKNKTTARTSIKIGELLAFCDVDVDLNQKQNELKRKSSIRNNCSKLCAFLVPKLIQHHNSYLLTEIKSE